MTNDLDKMISETLDDEDREILEKIGQEQTFGEMATDLFRGRFGWVNGLIFFGHVVFIAIGVYGAYRCFTTVDLIEVVRWGLVATVFLLAGLIARVTLIPGLQANRVLRAVKHLEMQVSLLATKK